MTGAQIFAYLVLPSLILCGALYGLRKTQAEADRLRDSEENFRRKEAEAVQRGG